MGLGVLGQHPGRPRRPGRRRVPHPDVKDPNQGSIDLVGALASIIGLGTLLFGIIEGPTKGWTDSLVLARVRDRAPSRSSFFVAWELHVAEPMLDMRFFQNPRFSAANGAITMTFFALFGSMFLMTQYWQLVHGYSPLGAGVRLIPYALTMMITAPLSARLVERIGTKRVITSGLLIVGGALVTLSFIHATTPYPRVISVFCVMAVGMGLTMAPATESVMGSLPRAQGRRRIGGQRHDPPGRRRTRRRDHRQRRDQPLRQPIRRGASRFGLDGTDLGSGEGVAAQRARHRRHVAEPDRTAFRARSRMRSSGRS